MTTLGLFLLQASACMIIFYTAYYLFLRRLTFFRWNRVYLLITLVLSILIPLLNFEIGTDEKSQLKQFIPYWYIEDNKITGINNLGSENEIGWASFVLWIYYTGAALMLIKLLGNLLVIFRVYRKKAIKYTGGIRIVEGSQQINNCSFLDTIFLKPGSLNTNELEQVLKHEECHIRHFHTYDKLFIQLVQVIFWFNPIIYFYRRSVEDVHEFEADALLTRQTDKEHYANLLLRIAMDNQIHLLNCFSRHSLKTRIQMLFNRKSHKIKITGYFIIFPLVMLTIVSFSINGKPNFDTSDHLKLPYVTNDSLKQKVYPLRNNIPGKNINSKPQSTIPVENTVVQSMDKSNPELTENEKVPEAANNKITHIAKSDIAGNTSPAPLSDRPFFTRKPVYDEAGNEFDEFRIHFGKSSLVGALAKGGKVLYLVQGKEYPEDEFKNLSPAEIEKLSCPCKIRIRDKDNEELFPGSYDGVVEISGKK